MNIIYCLDETFVMPCCISIISLCKHNDNLNIYVFNDGLSRSSRSYIYQTGTEYGIDIQFVDMATTCLDRFPTTSEFSKSVYYRFLLAELFPDDDKLLYLDSDIIVSSSLKSLWETDIKDYACGCVMDFANGNITLRNRAGLYLKDIYFNSGVLLLNLAFWREHKIKDKLFHYVAENSKKILYPDQDALNGVLKGKVRHLGLRYNVQSGFFYEFSNVLFEQDYWEECLCACNNPAIIHFTSPDKPWYSNCRHPLKGEFLKYYELSIFKSKKLRSREKSFSERMNTLKLIIRLLKPAKVPYRKNREIRN